jgi:hypothetical protein
MVLLNLTELTFVLLLTISIYLLIRNDIKLLFSAGILIGISIAVRPLGWAFLAAILLFHFYQFIKTKKSNVGLISVYAGTVLFIFLFGSFNYLHFGKFEFTATTGPVNLLLGANDDATGGFNSIVYEKGNIGYIKNPEKLTYEQKGDFYLTQAINWIEENPSKWISLIPMKSIHTFAWDDISVTALFNTNDWNFAKAVKNLFINKDINSVLPNSGLFTSLLYLFIQTVHHLFYYFLLVLITLKIINYLKVKIKNREVILILIFSLISVFMILVTVGAPRYKYHIIILLLPLAADYFEVMLLKSRK